MEDKTDPVYDFERFQTMSSCKKAASLYKLLECRLEEDSYNSAHTLLNMILPDSSDTKIITCDKKLVNGIELCDIMIFDKSAIYLVHVKAKFNGESIRAVCSQIRNAADYIYREITLGRSTGIFDQYWKELTKAAAKPTTHGNEVKSVLENMTKKTFKEYFKEGRDIIFVLACRDTRKNAEFIEFGDNSGLLKVPLAEEIQKKIKENTSEVISKLTKEKFLTEDGHLTNKFILKGKNTKEAFIEKIKQWKCIKNKKTARNVSKVLMSGLSKSKSTIAKMDIIRLLKDFERYNVDDRKLQLKLLSIKKDFP
ncbi:uncharacterized protein LOC132748128 isoform X2 [Ruditapes philippinarum]|jgi:hypothetical protein|uniref:uncharacterized protein LOC132748128 isoform X2 n=1 Tax=Ruditapes philippinarum TaxID=129788 RepID=UPI00295C1DBA|nr:uncharacterized protein LOC132748128 isoform X2 [Ruditapes philippinarum]